MSEWISVTERMPEGYLPVLVVDVGAQIFTAYFQPHKGGTDGRQANTWWREDGNDDYQLFSITHWMPLPEPPK